MSYPKPARGTWPPDTPPTHGDRYIRRGMRWDILSYLAKQNSWQRLVEVGTADGRTAGKVLRACPSLHVTMVDLWKPQPDNDGPEDWADWPHAKFEAAARKVAEGYPGRCDVLKMSSLEAAKLFPDQYLDAVFLDADHSEDAVAADIQAWAPKVRPSGWMIGHDINWPGVKAAVEVWYPRYLVGGNSTWIIQL